MPIVVILRPLFAAAVTFVAVGFPTTSSAALQAPLPLGGRHAPSPSDVIPAARAVLDYELPDYPSARIRNVRAVEAMGEVGFCGSMNMKGRAGGYLGWSEFWVGAKAYHSDDMPSGEYLEWVKRCGKEIPSLDQVDYGPALSPTAAPAP